MNSYFVTRTMTALVLSLFTVCLLAQDPAKSGNFEPYSGQDGKDVVWVPTPQLLVEKMLDMAGVSAQDYLMDLGSGDGRLVITAAKRGAKSLGIEYNPEMVALSKQNAAREGVSGKADFMQADLFEVDLSKATVITLFLTTHLNLRLRPKLLELKPGTRIVSNTFTMEDWVADESYMIEDDCYSWCNALLWIVPAKVQGTWKLQGGDLTLNQEFQVVTGTIKNGKDSSSFTGGRLKGNEISFTVKGTEYTGIVNGNTITGTMKSGGTTSKWTATKTSS